MLFTPHVVSFAIVTVPVDVSVAKTFAPAALACNANVGVLTSTACVAFDPIEPPVDIIDIWFAVIGVVVPMVPIKPVFAK